jgi:hypothetical protein
MPTLELTPEQRDRIEQLRAALTDDHAGPYATVGTGETVTYLLDLADAVDDPGHRADPTELAARNTPAPPFDRATARAALEDRNLRHGDPDSADRLDLHEIAAAFDVTGRSDMQKDELVEAILDRAATLAANPFALVDLDLPDQTPAEAAREPASSVDSSETSDSSGTADDTARDGGQADAAAGVADAQTTDDDDRADDGGAGQLNAMMRLLDTHADKWSESAGDARYEVELPDGSIEAARTKDDVRALLFKHY